MILENDINNDFGQMENIYNKDSMVKNNFKFRMLKGKKWIWYRLFPKWRKLIGYIISLFRCLLKRKETNLKILSLILCCMSTLLLIYFLF